MESMDEKNTQLLSAGDNKNSRPDIAAGSGRRRFLGTIGNTTASLLGIAAVRREARAADSRVCDTEAECDRLARERARKAFQVRKDAAMDQFRSPNVEHPTN